MFHVCSWPREPTIPTEQTTRACGTGPLLPGGLAGRRRWRLSGASTAGGRCCGAARSHRCSAKPHRVSSALLPLRPAAATRCGRSRPYGTGGAVGGSSGVPKSRNAPDKPAWRRSPSDTAPVASRRIRRWMPPIRIARSNPSSPDRPSG